jgi:hypothetical protein
MEREMAIGNIGLTRHHGRNVLTGKFLAASEAEQGKWRKGRLAIRREAAASQFIDRLR